MAQPKKWRDNAEKLRAFRARRQRRKNAMLAFRDKILTGDAATVLKLFPDDVIDLTVTSPPYDRLRKYRGFKFDFAKIAAELYHPNDPSQIA
jgi:DNA modification methylase